MEEQEERTYIIILQDDTKHEAKGINKLDAVLNFQLENLKNGLYTIEIKDIYEVERIDQTIH